MSNFNRRAEIVARQKSMAGISSKEHARENGVFVSKRSYGLLKVNVTLGSSKGCQVYVRGGAGKEGL